MAISKINIFERRSKRYVLLLGAWRNLIGTWSDSGASWTGSIPYDDAQWHYGPARLWTTPMNTDQYSELYHLSAILFD